ncbi:LLM class flavin-dependent oxidoreductase [Mesorhizobium sp. DCY119]|uniref:LLM class flavin-dependent oxidoreductase n=1 Tax=Mesorhizobium sp. DCY119 TaxID=2108445 RepID=UPI000E746BC9|nr:LLM class flavin-dependent oxidoreductase [Mesorhizobium sp. DCY119]RJG40547.1 LLM class flavin-dependent oxidoreductase [Mesorhizobium sp. DCY119]
MAGSSIKHLGFLTPGNYPDDDPFDGLEKALQIFELGERLGYDSAWIRQRHLEPGVSSAAAFLAAATQRTSHIQLGTAVISIGYESPYRLAEDLATVDVLSKGRLNVGLSAGKPLHADLLGPLVFDGNWQDYDFSHARVARLADNLRGEFLGGPQTHIEFPGGRLRPRLQPYAKGLVDRLWYGGGSLKSASWAGENGLNILLSNVTTGENTDDFFEAQLRQLGAYHAHYKASRLPRVALGRVIVPFDSADARTRQKYADYAAGRHERTLRPNGERRTLFVGDLVGTSEQILESLLDDPVLDQVQELRVELPYEFSQHEYEQILNDFIEHIAPELGWTTVTGPRSVLDAQSPKVVSR